MNDPNKAIQVNLSSLLSLKAELLRKQAEVNKAKTTRVLANDFVAKKGSNKHLNEKKIEKSVDAKSENAVVHEHEDSALWQKSQRILEAKSKFYERMSHSGGNLNTDDHCLVLFNRKQQENKNDDSIATGECTVDDVSSDSSEDEENVGSIDPEDDWVEYIDCLGRTRKCLRKDLYEAKRQDAKLAASMPERLDQNKANWMIDTTQAHTNKEDVIGPLPPESVLSDGCSLISKHDEQRANWERKELENLDKSDVHYQDVFFDEARQHGVGYYAFSTDEEARKRQQRQLENARQRTIAAQKQRDELRTQREKIIEERVLAAKNRQRARLGLPPLEKSIEETKSATEEEKIETKAERKERKRSEKLKLRLEQEEKQRELERQHYVRPWDKDKSGVPQETSSVADQDESTEWVYKAERLPMSQAEWNEQKRAERKPEFAPILEESISVQPKRTNFNSMAPPPQPPLPTYPVMAEENFRNFQSTSERRFQKRNYNNDNYETSTNKGVAIPPPANLDIDDSLPSYTKKSKSSIELERSIEAGLRFLRNNSDKDTMSTKSTWTARADY